MSEWLNMGYKELKEHLTMGPGPGRFELAKALLEIRIMEAQEKTAGALVASTDELVKATKALGKFTLALVLVTGVLVLVTAATVLWPLLTQHNSVRP